MRTPLGIDWSVFVQLTDRGTTLLRATVNQARFDLDSWAFQERSGINMPVGQRINMVAWKSVFEKLEMDPATADGKKVFSALEKDLEAWLQRQAAAGTASIPALDPKVEAKVIASMHKVFNDRKTNEMVIYALSALMSVDSDEKDLDKIGSDIRAVAKRNPKLFVVGRGGSPVVYRLLDKTGKATKVVLPESSSNGGGASKKLMPTKYTSTIKNLGISKSQHEAAKTAGVTTIAELIAKFPKA